MGNQQSGAGGGGGKDKVPYRINFVGFFILLKDAGIWCRLLT
jgi:hypothetical protein